MRQLPFDSFPIAGGFANRLGLQLSPIVYILDGSKSVPEVGDRGLQRQPEESLAPGGALSQVALDGPSCPGVTPLHSEPNTLHEANFDRLAWREGLELG